MEVQDAHAIASHADLGEGPLWNDAEALLYWIGASGRELCRGAPGQKAFQGWDLPDYPGGSTLRRGGGLTVALRRSIIPFEPDTGQQRAAPRPGTDFYAERVSGGAVGRAGRFFALEVGLPGLPEPRFAN